MATVTPPTDFDPLTRATARKAARRLVKAGYKFVTIVESFPEGEVSVVSYNRCFVKRTVTTLDDLNVLLRWEAP